MFGLSFFEILFLAALALIVIGPKQLPDVARTIGRFINELRRTTNVMTEQMKQSVWTDQPSQPPPPAAAKPPYEQPVIPHVPVSYDQEAKPADSNVGKKDDSGHV